MTVGMAHYLIFIEILCLSSSGVFFFSWSGGGGVILMVVENWIYEILSALSRCLLPGQSTPIHHVTTQTCTYTVPFQSIRQVPWCVTHLTKIWFRQPPNFAVTCTKNFGSLAPQATKNSILGIWSPNDFVTSPKWPWQLWHFVDFGRPVTHDWQIDWNGTVSLSVLTQL